MDAGHAEYDPTLLTRPPVIIFTRAAGQLRDSMRAYRLLLDGHECGRIAAGGEVNVPVSPGVHYVQARIDWTGSETVRLECPIGASIRVAVSPAGATFTAPFQALSRTRYITIEVQST